MYQMTKWQDHVTSPSSCYHINKTPETESDVYTITPAGTVMEQGTPQDQEHFNNMEIGIMDAHVSIGLLINFARQNAFVLETGQVVLKNTANYPFNNSVQSVSMDNRPTASKSRTPDPHRLRLSSTL